MTALSFPTSPNNGAIYEAPNNTVYIFDGQKWNVQGTTVTTAASVNFIQDTIAPLFTGIQGTGISFTYNSQTNSLSATVSGDGSGLSISDFGEGFSLTAANKIVTNKLYSTNLTQPTQHYRLEVDTNGVVILPDQSIINGATLKTVPGNWAGITAGPQGADEDSWVWVDNNGATIATKYSTDAHTWTFNNSGALTFPQGTTIATADGTDAFIIDGAVDKDIQIYTYSGPTAHGWTFGADGSLTFPNNNGQIGQLAAPYTGLEFRTGSGADWIGISYGEINDNNTSYFYFDKDGSNYTTANHRAHLQIKNPAHDGHVEWLFDSNGNLTIPYNGTIGDDLGQLTVPSAVSIAGSKVSLAWFDPAQINENIPAPLSNWGDKGVLANFDSLVIATNMSAIPNYEAIRAWTFGNDGKLSLPSDIKFSDNTIQTSAWTGSNPIDYANIVNVPIPPEIDIDGGHALASFTISANADGGGSSQRFGPNSPTINGGVAIETHTNTLDGGGA